MTGELVQVVTQDISRRDNSSYSPTQPAALDLQAALQALTPHTQTAYKRHLAGFLAYCAACGLSLIHISEPTRPY